jgi:hypothetical protein
VLFEHLQFCAFGETVDDIFTCAASRRKRIGPHPAADKWNARQTLPTPASAVWSLHISAIFREIVQ